MTRSHTRLVVICCVGLFLPLLFPLCTGRVFTRDDMAALHLPFRYLYSEALRSGDSFLWTPAFRSGLYLHGEGEAGMAHPLHLLLYRFLPLGPAFNVEIVSSYLALLVGTALLLRRLDVSREAAWFGSMLFTFGGFNLFNLMHVNHIAVLAHLPWLLLCAHVLLTSSDRRERAAAFAATACLVGSQWLVGNPQYVWITFIALVYLIACLVIAGAPTSRLGLVAGALMLGTLIGAVQLLPTLDFARASIRASWSLDDALAFSLAPMNLAQLWSPFAFQFRVYAPSSEAEIVHEFIVYNGAFCTIALAWLVARWRDLPRRDLLTALIGFAALNLVLAFGRYGVVYTWLAQLPGFRNFRAPARHIVLFQLALSGIAAVVFEDVIRLVRRGVKLAPARFWPVGASVGLSIAITAAAAAFAHSSWADSHGLPLSNLLRAAPWSAVIAAMAALVVLAARGVRWAMPIVIVLAAVDLGIWGYGYAYHWGPLRTIAELRANAAVPPEARPGDLIVPMVGGPINLPVLRGLRLTTGYSGVEPASVLDPNDPLTQRIAGAAWRPSGTHWIDVEHTMPRARLVSIAKPSVDVAADVRTIDISREALVDRSAGDLRGDPGTVRVLSDRGGSLEVETLAPGRQLLVLTERFHPGWRAAEDGRRRETVRVYGDFLGCVVEPGRHRVVMTFAPSSAQSGLRMSVTGVGLTVLVTSLFFVVGGPQTVRNPDARVNV